jgi:pyrroloquinoline quinone biosynthesis protein D
VTAAPITAATKPKLATGVRLRHDKLRDAWVLLAPESVIDANPVAVAIIKRCTGEATVEAMISDLAAAFGADRQQVENDVHAFLRQLADKRLVAL